MFSIEDLIEIAGVLKDADITSVGELKKYLPVPILYKVEIEFMDDIDKNITKLFGDLKKALQLYDKYRYTQFACGTLTDYKTKKTLSSYCNDWEDLTFYD